MKELNALRNTRLFAVLALGVVVLTSCSTETEGRSGVGVRSINTNIGLGVEIQAAAPANTVVTQPRRRLDEPSSTIPPFDFEIPKKTTRPCPEAGPFDFPAVDTGVEPKGRPVAGKVDWKLDGTLTTGYGEFEIDDFDERTVANVKDHDSIPSAFTFEVVEENLYDDRQNRGTLITRYRVVPDPAIKQEQVPNDAGKGLFIESLTFKTKDQQGKDVETTFNPAPAVQLLAFPVKDGTAINSTGSDTVGGASLTVEGVVKGKKQVDACGDRIDSWFVDAEFRFTTTDRRNGQTETFTSNYDYGVATQYGGQIVYEKVDAPRDEPVIQIEARVGSVPKASGG